VEKSKYEFCCTSLLLLNQYRWYLIEWIILKVFHWRVFFGLQGCRLGFNERGVVWECVQDTLHDDNDVIISFLQILCGRVEVSMCHESDHDWLRLFEEAEPSKSPILIALAPLFFFISNYLLFYIRWKRC
jgi:hypothetical protein